ncbi:MAG: hypothetical protein AAFY07_14020 [Pseudomonadota bacterium]
MSADRYTGKPFLRLIDSFVLDAIGALDDQAKEGLVTIEPKLEEAYGPHDGWQDVVTKNMNFPSDLPEKIEQIWLEVSARMREQGIEPDPHEFTRQFVDSNFL